MSSEHAKGFDDILTKLGEFGRYQVFVYGVLCIFMLVTPWQHFVYVFLTGNPEHRCKIPEWDSVDCEAFGFNTSSECAEAKIWAGIPHNVTPSGQIIYDQCSRYNVLGIAFSPDLDLAGTPVIPCDAGWDYGESERYTLNQEFDLVCGSKYLASMSQSLYFAGTALGSVFVGFLADKIGRKPAAMLCLAITCVSGLIISFSVNIYMFMILRLFVGAATIGVITDSYVLANEFIGISKRNFAGNIIWVSFALGFMLLSVLAYFITNWQHLQLVVALFPAIMFPLFCVLPESVRWLLNNGRKDDASTIIKKMAKTNRVYVTDAWVMNGIADDMDEKEKEAVDFKQTQDESESFVALLRRPKLRMYTLNVMFNIMANTLVYYGLSLGTGSLGVNIYIAFAISGGVEIPAVLFTIFPIEYWGRRPPYVIFMFLSGIACLVSTVIPLGPWRAAVALFGKFTISVSFSIIFLQACEIFPTTVRNSTFGFCRFFSFGSNILCPFILLLGDYWTPLPQIILGSLAIVAGGFAVLLPETRGKKMPETLEDGENIGWKGVPRKPKKSTKQYEMVNAEDVDKGLGEE